ncbi:MAG: TolC family protein [Armatimonadota bacterium]|nr:TolC family protein [Armatimonadota bacterium]
MRFATWLFIAIMVCSPALAQTPEKTEPSFPAITQSVSISEAVEIALKNNPRISSQSAMARAAQARVGMAKAMTRPRLSATTFATTGTFPSIIAGPPAVDPMPIMSTPNERQLDQNLMAMYPLYTGGRLKGQVGNARGLAKGAEAEAAGARLDVALDAKTAYRRALLASRFVEAYQKRVDEGRERLRIAQAAFDEGKIAKYDLLRNQTDLAESEQALVNAQRDVEIAQVDLKTALGLSLESKLTLTDQLAAQPGALPLADLQALALRQRPEISAARARIQAVQATTILAKSAYKPQVYAIAMQDFASTSGSSFDSGYTVGVVAGFPIFDGGQRKSAVKEARAMADQAEADLRSAQLAVSREVGTAWAESVAAATNTELAKAAVEQAEEDYRVIKLRYEAGKAINVEVLDALAALTRAETNYAQALYELNAAQDRLARAVGT